MPAADRLPALSTLRVFEAAARHPNFSAAAAELHVTPGAVSRQVTTLERQLAVKLFVREPRRNVLTPSGQQLAERVRDAFGQLHDALRAVALESTQRVVVTALPSFAARWLVPRLERFAATNPAIEIDLRPSRELVALDRGGLDLAIRYGRGRWPGAEARLLLEEQLFAACSPALAKRHHPRALTDLLGMPLIHDSDFPWSLLFEHHGVPLPKRVPGIRMDDSSIALQAAERGQGVILGRSVLVADAISEGRLVRATSFSVPSNFAYYVAWPRNREATPATVAVREWLMREAEEQKIRTRPSPRR